MAEQRADAAEIGRHAAEEMVGTARRGAARVGEQLREAAQAALREQKDRAADTVHGLAEALRRTAGSFEREENRAIARYAEQAAAQVDRFSETVRAREIGDLLAEAEDFARRQPSLFLAGAVATGFVIGRILARPGESGAGPRGPAMSGGERAPHAGDQSAEPLAGYGPISAGAGES
jgi:ElaB/YqjD/DUF883 family membrane-anchored ribosome-binding protein